LPWQITNFAEYLKSNIMVSLQSKKTVVAGGTSGIGLATALLFKKAGATVTVTGRNATKLSNAKKEGLQVAEVDSSNIPALVAFFNAQGNFDNLVIALGSTKGIGNFKDLSLDDVRAGFEEKYWAQLYTLKAALPYINAGGCITLITGNAASRQLPQTSGIGSINGALEIYVPILAKELQPLRINAVSPGIIDTPWWNFLPEDAKNKAFEEYATHIAVGRVGHPGDIAHTILFLSENDYMTGKIITCDGGSIS